VAGNGLQVQGYGTAGFGAGAELGYTSGTAYLQAYNRTGTAYLPLAVCGSTIRIAPLNSASQGMLIGTGAISGYGPTANAQVDMTPDKGSFIGTATGFTTNPTATISWAKMGNLVTLYAPGIGINATSNSAAFTIGQLPAEITPANNQVFPCAVTNNGSTAVGCIEVSTTNTLIFGAAFASGIGGFTASGFKGVTLPFSVTYSLV